MQLHWAKYTKNHKSKFLLLLELGYVADKLHCLDTDKLSAKDKEYLRAKSNYMESLSLDDRVEFIKNHRSSAIAAFKTINLTNIEIHKSYKINSIHQRS